MAWLGAESHTHGTAPLRATSDLFYWLHRSESCSFDTPFKAAITSPLGVDTPRFLFVESGVERAQNKSPRKVFKENTRLDRKLVE